MKRLLIFLVFVLSIACCIAQQASRYHVQQFTTDNGLPSNGLKGLQWDASTGFLWVATEAGVSRYNGVEFTNFTKKNTPGLLHERMAYAVKNSHGAIFATDVGENVLRVQKNSIAGIKLPETTGLLGNRKKIYVGTSGSDLRRKVLAFIKKRADVEPNNMLQLTDTSLLIIANQKNYYYISEGTGEYMHIPMNGTYFNPVLMGGEIFVTDATHKFYKFSIQKRTFTPVVIASSETIPFTISPDNFLLYYENGMKAPILFSGEKAWLLRYHNEIITADLICSGVPAYSYIRFAQYSEENKLLFIGTDSKGIIVINTNRVTTMKNADTDIRERNAYYSQVELANGNVLTNEAHVLGVSDLPATLPIKGRFDFSTYKFGDSLWYVQQNSQFKKNILHCYNYKTGQTIAYNNIAPVQSNFAMTCVNGQYYFGYSYGIGRLEGDSIRHLFRPGKNKKQQAASYAMTEFAPGLIGVASCDGLILYDVKKMTTDTILKPFGYCIRSLWKYKDYVFIGSYGKGYYIWKNGRLKEMPLDKNSFLLYTHCFVPDSLGYCWISSNRGLFKASLTDLTDAYENNRRQVYYHYFGKNDGMEITEMNGGCAPCGLALKNGTLSFPTMDGLLWVNPVLAKPLLPEGNIYIDEFLAGNKKINTDSLELVKLPYKDRDVNIRIGFSSWCNKENIYLEYQLDKSKEWVPVDVNKGAYISFNNLDPGKHYLRIRKLNGFGINNYSYKEITFSIQIPWTQRWWFYVLCGLVLFGLVALYLRFRTRQYQVRQKKLEEQVAGKTRELQQQNEMLEKNNAIKTRLISIISHDIVTPLKFVTVAGKNLMEKRTQMPEELQQETISEITNTSQELQLLSTNILNWIKYQNENRRMVKEHFNLREMVDQVLGILQSLAKQKKLSIENQVAEETEVYQLYEPLKILVYNLLTNAIHFTEKGTITVAADRDGDNIILQVKDEGTGMTQEQIQRLMADEVIITSANVDNKRGHGLGYLIIKDLIKTMNAGLNIKSTRGKGTTVYVRMPAVKSNDGG